jgi:predicted nucleic acid-binding Zn ribbon protein
MTTKRSNDQTLKQAIDGMFKSLHLDQKVNEVRVIASWEKVMGKTVSNRTSQIYMRDKKLFVYLDSASLREELHHSREKIIKLLNTEAGTEAVNEIIFQ